MDTPEKSNKNDKNRLLETKIGGFNLFHYINKLTSRLQGRLIKNVQSK